MMTNVEQGNEKDSKKIVTMLILVVTLAFCTTSATYAYFAIGATNNNTLTGTAATVNLTLTVTPAELKSGNTGVMVPQLANTLGTAMNATNKCVDANGNIVCKAYTITVTNNSTAAVTINGTIQFSITNISSSTNSVLTNLKWRRASSAVVLGTTTGGSYDGISVGTIDTNSATTNISNTSSIFDLTAGTVCTINSGNGCTDVKLEKSGVSGNSATYYIVIWIDEIGSDQSSSDKGKWQATIHFEGENGTGVTSTITS